MTSDPAADDEDRLPVPERWLTFASGRPQPDWVAAIHESRAGL